jgi:hypothetical protein
LSSLRNDRAPVDRDVDHRDEVSPARRVIEPLLVFGSAADVLNCLAAVFCSSRLTEIASWNTTVVLFHDEYTVSVLPPGIAAAISAIFELSCSVLIILGLATRLATQAVSQRSAGRRQSPISVGCAFPALSAAGSGAWSTSCSCPECAIEWS